MDLWQFNLKTEPRSSGRSLVASGHYRRAKQLTTTKHYYCYPNERPRETSSPQHPPQPYNRPLAHMCLQDLSLISWTGIVAVWLGSFLSQRGELPGSAICRTAIAFHLANAASKKTARRSRNGNKPLLFNLPRQERLAAANSLLYGTTYSSRRPSWIIQNFGGLLGHGMRPIFAHPPLSWSLVIIAYRSVPRWWIMTRMEQGSQETREPRW